MSLSIYGKLPSGERLKRITTAPNYREGSFQNISVTPAFAEDASFFKTMRDFLNKPKNVKPSKEIPHVKTDLKKLNHDKPVIVWFGHSSYLVKVNGKTILVDPVLSGNAAPVSCMVRAFKGADVYKAEHMPPIDVLLITHDHYDHLDYKAVVQLKGKVKKVVCSLGVGSHLEHWGFKEEMIHELNWWEEHKLEHLHFISVPGRHFSGRGLKRGQSVWGGFVLKTQDHTLFLGGDSGYDTHFKEIGEKHGPFDLAILESGQYNKSWPHIHMMPEQTVQASMDLKADVLLPVHWGKFTLAMHAWDEPIQRVLKKAEEHKVKVATPKIGELFILGETMPREEWWR
jgi:L-ascorbate metabolism protein UlaG (beta-lactamase superfamily)